MPVNQSEQFARSIAAVAGGCPVSLAEPDPELRETLATLGVNLSKEAGELVVATAPPTGLFASLPASTQSVLADPGGQLAPLLKEAAAHGFLPDLGYEPPALGADWVLFRRTDSHLNLRIDSLHAAAADLEAERQHLQGRLKDMSKELRAVKNSPAWLLVGRYRQWLDGRRKRRSLPFRLYDRMMGRIVQTSVQALVTEQVAEPPLRPLAPSTRFTMPVSAADTGPGQDWRRTFLGLAEYAGADTPLDTPKISIITPLWNTKPAWLAEAAVSVFDQTMTEWEWCIADDCSTQAEFQPVLDAIQRASPRVKVIRLAQNGGISNATNEAMGLARGKYVCFLDHDDLLHPEALEVCLDHFDRHGCDAVYTDSDKANEEGICDEPFYKPDWSPEYFRGVMYVGHLLCVLREPALQLGGFDSRFDGVQDFEFFLRYSERFKQIGHVTRVLYHWRRVPGSTAASGSAKKNINQLQQRAVGSQLERLQINAQAQRGSWPHRVKVVPGARRDFPRISIIIPTKDAPEVLSKCLDSIFRKSTYKNFQLICADNGTTDSKALNLMRRPGVDRVACPGTFNFSRVNNDSVKLADGEFLLFLNNDIEVITPDWMEHLLFHAEQPDVGAVGAMLLYPDKRVQHCGIALGFRGTADHILRGGEATSDGYAGSLAHARECSAVTAACMMMRRSVFEEAGGFDEHYFSAYQDVDLCLRLWERGLRNVYTPLATLYHHESYSRKTYYDWVDRNLLLDAWEELIEQGDPYYNVNFDRDKTDYQIAKRADRGQVAPRIELYAVAPAGAPALMASASKSW